MLTALPGELPMPVACPGAILAPESQGLTGLEDALSQLTLLTGLVSLRGGIAVAR